MIITGGWNDDGVRNYVVTWTPQAGFRQITGMLATRISPTVGEGENEPVPQSGVTSSSFVEAASIYPEPWSALVGAECTHFKRGMGRISERDPQSGRVFVSFDDGPGYFSADVFCDQFITSLTLVVPSPALAVLLTKALTEVSQVRASRLEFAELRLRFGFDETHELDALGFATLRKLAHDQDLDGEEFEWLESEGRYDLAAATHQLHARRQGSQSRMAKASSLWRKAAQPQRAVDLTDELVSTGSAPANVWTSRGGAFRDLGDLAGAVSCGRKAVELNPESYHPHNLLGAALLEAGQTAAGEEHFRTAQLPGAPPHVLEASGRSFQKRSPDAAHHAALCLLNADPDKYGWAAKFISKPDITASAYPELLGWRRVE